MATARVGLGASALLSKVAIVGASGQLGKYIVGELQKNKQLRITALTRTGSSTQPPPGVKAVEVEYDRHASLVNALRGKEMLITTLAATAPPETSRRLADAAAEAGVRWFIPNEWGYDTKSAAAERENPVIAPTRADRDYFSSKGLTWIGISCGFWYEYSLAGGRRMFGIDAVNRRATLYDGGDRVAVSTSTWEQTARAVAALAALPQERQGANDDTPTIRRWANKHVHVDSFTLTQRQMLDEVQKATQTTDDDWTIDTPSASEVYYSAMERLKTGGHDWPALTSAMYARMFYDDEPANMVKAFGLDNRLLGLPQEDLRACTERAIAMQREQQKAG